MLVTCRNCSTMFDLAIGHCVACGQEHLPTETEHYEIVRSQIHRMLERGVPPTEIESRLTDDIGLSNLDANEKIQSVMDELLVESRAGKRVFLTRVALLSFLVAAAVSFGVMFYLTLGELAVSLFGFICSIVAWLAWRKFRRSLY